MDVVYLNKEGENEELRYSLRTLRNVKHGHVWIFGGCPSWVDTDLVRHERRVQKASAYSSTRAHIAAACKNSNVSDPFMVWNDDFYAMEIIGDVPIMHRGTLAHALERFGGLKTGWAKGMRQTAAMLRTVRGEEEHFCYDFHAPLIIYKDQMLEALELAKEVKTDAVHLRTLYGNLDPIGGVEIEDVKMTRRNAPFPTGPWLSSGDDTFRSTIEPVLRYLFPEPCTYEKGVQ